MINVKTHKNEFLDRDGIGEDELIEIINNELVANSKNTNEYDYNDWCEWAELQNGGHYLITMDTSSLNPVIVAHMYEPERGESYFTLWATPAQLREYQIPEPIILILSQLNDAFEAHPEWSDG